MPNVQAFNIQVINPKPKDISVIDPKPKDIAVIDSKPKDISVFGVTKIYTENRIFVVGQPIPLGGFILTYPTAGTWTNATRL